MINLTDLQDRYPSGLYSEEHGCYYFLDYDLDLGYFIQYTNGQFESETQYVDFDTLADDERQECETISNQILLNQ